jgi:hypothetical protein
MGERVIFGKWSKCLIVGEGIESYRPAIGAYKANAEEIMRGSGKNREKE